MKLVFIFSLLIIFLILLLLTKNIHSENFTDSTLSYTSTNARQDDKFISLWNKELFGTPNDIKINYIIDYHYITEYPRLDNTYNILLDSEPADVSSSKPDLVITCKKEKIPNQKKVYFPYFSWAFLEKRMDPEVLIKKPDEHIEKNKFCCFMYTNCREYMNGVKRRKEFYELIQKMTNNRVDNLGRCYNKDYKFNGAWTDQIDIYRPYKFVIAFENNNLEGYITEKLAFPLAARAIPIYYGCKEASKYFNKKAYIDVNDFPDFKTCIQYILKVDSDPDLYRKILDEPALINNKVDKDLFSLFYGGQFYRDLYNNMDYLLRDKIRPCKFYPFNIKFITFADGEKYTTERIMKEAYNSGFFKECVSYGPKDFDETFLNRHKKFIENNKRGYGYWIWKPYLILKTLSFMRDGDYLVYLDSGTTIHVENPKRVKEYYEMLQNYDMVMFRIKHDEKTWCKMDTANQVIKQVGKKDIEYLFEEDPKQRTGGIILMKKSPTTLDIISKWYEIACDYNFIDDSQSLLKNDLSFIEHRHDQSIISCITKLYDTVHICDNNYSDHPLEHNLDEKTFKPFVLSRKKR
jgi:hypothetical protein